MAKVCTALSLLRVGLSEEAALDCFGGFICRPASRSEGKGVAIDYRKLLLELFPPSQVGRPDSCLQFAAALWKRNPRRSSRDSVDETQLSDKPPRARQTLREPKAAVAEVDLLERAVTDAIRSRWPTLMVAFRGLDMNRDGMLERGEFGVAIHSVLGMDPQPEVLAELWARWDADQAGQVRRRDLKALRRDEP